MKRLGWETLCEKPQWEVLQLVREFYVNITDDQQSVATVRGCKVIFYADTINTIYSLENMYGGEVNASMASV